MKSAIAVDEPRIWSSVLRGLMLPMEELNLNPQDLLVHCKIPLSVVERSQEAVPIRKYLSFWQAAEKASKDPFIAIHLARSAGPETLGPLGFLFLSSRTLNDALSNLCAYINLLQDATHVQLSQDANELVWCYDLAPVTDMENRLDIEFSMALMVRLTRMYTGFHHRPLRVSFRHAPQPNAKVSEYQRLMRVPVFFEEEANSITLPAAAGHFKGNNFDRNLSAILKEFLDEQLTHYMPKKSFADQVYDLIYSGNFETPQSANAIAERFGISQATLHRHLREDGVSLSEIISRRQYEMAQEYLKSSSLEIIQIAHMVGFSESASFTRAFKRWSDGTTPSAFRKMAKARTGAIS